MVQKKKLKKNKWKYGEYRIIKGSVIEKGGVAFSNVIGKFPKDFAKKIPGTKKNNKFNISITFDDGYKDNLSYVLPILNELNVPATIYVITKFFENDYSI